MATASNQKLWNQVLREAKAKYPPKNPKHPMNRAVASWATKEYERRGGTWGLIEIPDPKAEALKKQKAKIAEKKREKKKAGLV